MLPQAKELPKARRGAQNRTFPNNLQRQQGPASNLILDVQPPELGDNKFVWFGFALRFYLFIFRERRKRGRETSAYGCCSCAPHWGPGLQLRHVPNLGPHPHHHPGLYAGTQFTEPHQAGHKFVFLNQSVCGGLLRQPLQTNISSHSPCSPPPSVLRQTLISFCLCRFACSGLFT